MTDLAELGVRIRRLEDIEAIKMLKYKYFRALDSKLWDELAQCFTDDATTGYSDGDLRFQGVDEIIGFLKSSMRDSFFGIHHGHHPEIEVTSESTAHGVWAFYSYMIDSQEKMGLRMGALYYDDYVRIDGQWRIKHTGYNTIFQEVWNREEIRSLALTAAMKFESDKE
jgi:hypothetical protein